MNTQELSHTAFDRTFYELTAAPVLTTLVVMSLIPCAMPLFFFGLGRLMRRLYAGRVVTVMQMRALFQGPPYYFACTAAAARTLVFPPAFD